MGLNISASNAFELDLTRSSAFLQLGNLCACLTGAVPGEPFCGALRYAQGNGWRLVLGPIALDVGTA